MSVRFKKKFDMIALRVVGAILISANIVALVIISRAW